MPRQDVVKTTCPRDCYDACGISVIRRDGVIAKILGDPEHEISRGGLCGKCAIAYNGPWRDPEARLTTPLRRIGPKGARHFAPISWDEALEEIATQFKGLIAANQAYSILHSHYTGTVGLLGGGFPMRFFHRLGATEIDPDTVCNKAGHVALEWVFGTSVDGFDPRSIVNSRTLLIWGANPSHSAPHQDRYWIKEAKARGTRIIVIDPLAHDTARAADLHLKLRPGTDAALAFAMLHVLRREGLVDEAFLERHVLGAADLIPSIDLMPPDRAAEICGLTESDIEAAARVYGNGRALLWLGQGVQRQRDGGNIFRAASALVAFTGNIGKPGAGFLYLNGASNRGIDLDTLTLPSLARDPKVSISHMDLAAVLEDARRARAFVTWNNNPAASSPEQGRLRRALARDGMFHVAIDLFHTDTTAYADIVLPAASFLEFDDLILSYFDLTASAQVKAADPPGLALPNSEIFRRLSRAMGFDDLALFEDDATVIAGLLEQTPYGGSFEALSRAGTVTLYPTPRIQFETLSFATPSGKIELANEQAIALGLPRLPQPHGDTVAPRGKLRILSPASAWLMNSSYFNSAEIRKKLGPQKITLHPEDGLAFGIAEGDAVMIENEGGELPLTVTISEITQPGVGIVYKGRWPGESPGNANINLLVSADKSDLGESTALHGTLVSLHRATDRA